MKIGTFKHYHPHDPDKISDGVDVIEFLCPFRHTFNRGKKATHQDEDHHEEKRNQHGLLLSISHRGDQQPKS